jgi:FlaA1/EpsC-like NDP-sugar epimerase
MYAIIVYDTKTWSALCCFLSLNFSLNFLLLDPKATQEPLIVTMLYIILGVVALVLVHAWLMSTKPHKINWATSHVVITGGSSGIGLCTALMTVKRGANVTILARNADKLKAALKQLETARINGVS